MRPTARLVLVCLAVMGIGVPAQQAQPPRPNQDYQPPRATQKPPLHGRQWMAMTGKPLGATAGAMIFQQGGNAIDAACAMLAAVSTMWDTLGWGGETQALIYNPHTKKVIGINALGSAPSGHRRVLQVARLQLPSRVRPACRGHTPGA
jgi:gamma-glutamyltranspeptidase / glutathione hydrolase